MAVRTSPSKGGFTGASEGHELLKASRRQELRSIRPLNVGTRSSSLDDLASGHDRALERRSEPERPRGAGHSVACGPTATAPTSTRSPGSAKRRTNRRASAARTSRDAASTSTPSAPRRGVALGPPHGRHLRVGEDSGRNRAVVGLRLAPARVGAATRAWYLPTCVKSATPVTSPIAQTFSAARSRSSTSMPRGPIETPSCSSPSPAVVRPSPGRDEQRAPPRPSSRRRASASTPGVGSSTRDPDPDVDPSSRKTSAMIAPASSCTRPSRRGPCSITVTREPIAREELRELCADRAAAHDGEALRHLVRRRRFDVRPVLESSSPSTGGNGRPRAGRDDEPVVRELLARRPRRCRPRDAPVAAHERAPLILEQSSCDESSQSLVTQSRHDQTPSGTGRSGSRPARGRATTRAPRRAASSSSACTRSTSTRRRRAGARRA